MKEMNGIRERQALAGLDHMFAMREILTPEQRSIWKEHHRGRMLGNRRDDRGGRPFRNFDEGGCAGCGGSGQFHHFWQ